MRYVTLWLALLVRAFTDFCDWFISRINWNIRSGISCSWHCCSALLLQQMKISVTIMMVCGFFLMQQQEGAQVSETHFSREVWSQVMVLITSKWLKKMSLWKKPDKIGVYLLFNLFVLASQCMVLIYIYISCCLVQSPIHSIVLKQDFKLIFIFFCWKGGNAKDKRI